MKLKCIKSAFLYDENGKELYQSFTEGKEYNARKVIEHGLDGDPFSVIEVLKAKNDNGVMHIVKSVYL